MDSDACVSPQFLLQCGVDLGHSVWRRLHVNVVQESKNEFTPSEPALDRAQCGMLTQRKEEWHHRVALFSPFTLVNVMYHAFRILPKIP